LTGFELKKTPLPGGTTKRGWPLLIVTARKELRYGGGVLFKKVDDQNGE